MAPTAAKAAPALAAREDVADAADRLEQVISAYWP
jgi:hypothetical protein